MIAAHRRVFSLVLATMIVATVIQRQAYAEDILNVDAYDSGWYHAYYYEHDPANLNYLVGMSQYNGWTEHRDFFAFDLTSFPTSGAVVDAQLIIFHTATITDDPFETLTLFEVQTSVADVLAGGNGKKSIFDDLGDGTVFGERNYSDAANENTYTAIQLNSSAIDFLNSKRGSSLVIGGAITTLAPGAQQAVFASSGGPRYPVPYLSLTIGQVPEPGHLGLLAFGGTFLLRVRRLCEA